MIRLKDCIDGELIVAGFKPGDIIDADPDPNSTSGVVHFKSQVHHREYECSVWPLDYEMLRPNQEIKETL